MKDHGKARRDNLSKLRKITSRNPKLWIPSRERSPDGALGVPTFEDLPLGGSLQDQIRGGSNAV